MCFLDFTELFTYNFVQPVPPQDDIPRPPLDTVEATRLIFMELKVTKIEQPGEDDGQDYPIVHFRGTSRSMDASYDPNAHSNIRGGSSFFIFNLYLVFSIFLEALLLLFQVSVINHHYSQRYIIPFFILSLLHFII